MSADPGGISIVCDDLVLGIAIFLHVGAIILMIGISVIIHVILYHIKKEERKLWPAPVLGIAATYLVAYIIWNDEESLNYWLLIAACIAGSALGYFIAPKEK